MAAPRILKRFPLSLGIGTDICHVVRVERILKSSRGARFVEKILRPDERCHPKIRGLLKSQNSRPALSFHHEERASSPISKQLKKNDEEEEEEEAHGGLNSAQDIQIAATFMAGRFAAKEAVIKAHPHRALTWHDITIQSQASGHPDRKGAPLAIVRGEREDYEALVSISHDGEYATAVCLGAGAA